MHKDASLSSIQPIVPVGYVWPDLEQLLVYSQENTDGGGEASCGYHALLRGMQVVRAKNEGQTDGILEQTLMSSKDITEYFAKDRLDSNKNGKWRKDIILLRKKNALRNALHLIFLSGLNKKCDDRIKSLYISALGALEEEIIVSSENNSLLKADDKSRGEAFLNDFIRLLASKSGSADQRFMASAASPDTIKNCFNFDTIEQQLFAEKGFSGFIEKIYTDYNVRQKFDGEWLTDGEVEYLWDNKKSEFISGNVHCGFKVVANFDLVGNQNISLDFDEAFVYIRDSVRPILNKSQEVFQVFILGTMRQYDDTTGSSGHWYCLVMHQNGLGKRKYYVMDSKDNKDRVKNSVLAADTWKIINLIEQ